MFIVKATPRLAAFLLALLFSVAAFAAGSGFAGRVVGQSPGAPPTPIQGVAVEVLKHDDVLSVTTTDVNGNYTISGLPEGTYSVVFAKPNFLLGVLRNYKLQSDSLMFLDAALTPTLDGIEVEDAEKAEHLWTIVNNNSFPIPYSWSLPRSRLSGTATAPPGSSTLDSGTHKHDESIQLFVNGLPVQPRGTSVVSPPVAPGSISGLVTDTRGNPLGGVGVTAVDSNGFSQGGVSTRADGTYSVSGIHPGGYTVTFMKSGFTTLTATTTVSAGGTSLLNESLSASAPGSISGVVSSTFDGLPLQGVSVTVLDALGQVAASTSTGAAGDYSVQVAPGIFTVQFQLAGYTDSSSGGVIVNSNAATPVNGLMTPSGPVVGSVNGTVMDDHGAPIAFATVTATVGNNPNPVGQALTNLNGNYSLPSVPAGVLTLVASASGYDNSSVNVSVPYQGSVVQNLVLMATVPGSLVGVVTDGVNPLSGVSVTVLLGSATVGQAQTAADGSYEVDNLAPGTYSVQFSLLHFQNLSLQAVVNEGQATSLSEALTPSPTAQVIVTVKSAANNSLIAGAKVTILYANDPTTASGFTDASGQVVFDGQPISEDATVLAELDGPNQIVLATSGQLVSGGFVQGADGVQLLFASGSISGVATDTGSGLPLGGVQVVAFDSNSVQQAIAFTGLDGTYQLPGLTPGVYSLQFTLDGYTSSTVSGVLVISAQTAAANAGLTFIPQFGNVAGTVFGPFGIHIPSCQVDLAVDGSTIQSTTSASDGSYSFSNVPAGPVTLTFTASGYAVATATSNVVANQTTPQNVTLTSLTTVYEYAGKVQTGSPSVPLPGDLVSAYDLNGNLVFQTTTDANGQFVLAPLAPGLYGVTYVKSGYGTESQLVDLRSGSITGVVLGTAAGATTGNIFATVKNPSGGAIVGATVNFTDWQGNTQFTGTTNSSGTVVVSGITPGLYKAVCSASGFTTNTALIPDNAQVTNGTTVVLQNGTTATINVTVLDQGGNPVPGATVTAAVSGNIQVPGSQPPNVVQTTDSNGKTTFTGILPGYFTTVTALQFVPNTTTVLNSRAASFNVLPPTVMNSTIQFQTTSIGGNVKNQTTGLPIAGVTITLANSNNVTVATVTTNSSGIYTINGVVPGFYTITASTTGFNSASIGPILVSSSGLGNQNFLLSPTP